MRFLLILFLSTLLSAETRTLTLKEVADRALRESPELVTARLKEQIASLGVGVARDPFRPKIFAGSGLAYSSGFPMSIEGSSPSIFQVKAVSSIFNRSQSYRVAQAAEQARTTQIDTQIRREDILRQAATLFLDAIRWVRIAESVHAETQSLERSEESVRVRVREGRELEIEAKRAALELARARYRAETAAQERNHSERTLATLLGYAPGDQVHPATLESPLLEIPASEEAAVNTALEQSRELRRIESAILAKSHEARSHRAAQFPTVDLVAQYALFAKFNNYEDYFQRFQRHNGQLGVSFQLPILPSSGEMARAAQAETEIRRLRAESALTRSRLSADVRSSWGRIRMEDLAREVARLDLEVARENVNLLLARGEEGRASLREIEQARVEEQEKWIAYFNAQFNSGQARIDLLHQIGNLVPALQ